MATPYSGNVTPLAQPAPDTAAIPVIRKIRLSDLHDALRLGWEDFKAVPSHAAILCVIYPILGLVLARTVLGYSVLPLLFPLAAVVLLTDGGRNAGGTTQDAAAIGRVRRGQPGLANGAPSRRLPRACSQPSSAAAHDSQMRHPRIDRSKEER